MQKGETMREIHKRIGSVILSMILLPYIITLFMNGENGSLLSIGQTNSTVEVSIDDRIEIISEEDYIIGILAKEIPENYVLESMKTQAIIIRTRLYKESFNIEDYSYTDSYLSYEEIIKKWSYTEASKVYSDLKEAVVSTENLVITVDDEMIITPYHLQNSGNTRAGDIALGTDYKHLQSVECSLDVTGINASSKYRISYTELAEKIDLDMELSYDDIHIISTAEDGYLTEISIGEKILTGEQLRQLCQLNSTVISLQEGDETQFQITTRGSGHGIGLSQNTANYMALEGKNYKEILEYFYKEIEIKSIEEIA